MRFKGYRIMAYPFYEDKPVFLALRYTDIAAIATAHEFRNRWPGHMMIIEEEYRP